MADDTRRYEDAIKCCFWKSRENRKHYENFVELLMAEFEGSYDLDSVMTLKESDPMHATLYIVGSIYTELLKESEGSEGVRDFYEKIRPLREGTDIIAFESRSQMPEASESDVVKALSDKYNTRESVLELIITDTGELIEYVNSYFLSKGVIKSVYSPEVVSGARAAIIIEDYLGKDAIDNVAEGLLQTGDVDLLLIYTLFKAVVFERTEKEGWAQGRDHLQSEITELKDKLEEYEAKNESLFETAETLSSEKADLVTKINHLEAGVRVLKEDLKEASAAGNLEQYLNEKKERIREILRQGTDRFGNLFYANESEINRHLNALLADGQLNEKLLAELILDYDKYDRRYDNLLNELKSRRR
jgi:hypothetical protein